MAAVCSKLGYGGDQIFLERLFQIIDDDGGQFAEHEALSERVVAVGDSAALLQAPGKLHSRSLFTHLQCSQRGGLSVSQNYCSRSAHT